MKRDFEDLIKKIQKMQCFIFDFDGTLINSEPHHMRAHSIVMSEILGKPLVLNNQTFKPFLGKNDFQIYTEFSKINNVNFDVENAIEMKQKTALNLLNDEKIKIFDYFYEIIKNKPKNSKFYILSNQCEMILLNTLKSKGIIKYFDNIYCLPKMKITKDYFLDNINQYILDLAPKSTIIFEDSNKVLTKTHEMGFFTVGIESDMNRGDISCCDYKIAIEE